MLDLFLAVTKPLKKCLGRGGGGYFFLVRVLVDSVHGCSAHVPGQNMKAAGA